MALTSRRFVALAVVAALLPAGAMAQPVRTQSGRALDSNLRIGSGGYNRPVARRFRFNSQLYVTGQVTGLRRFQQETGYFAANELRLTLPSATLRQFRRESVGINQVLAGTLYRPSPYFDRMQTAFGMRGISAGLTAPGTTMPRSATPTVAATRKLYAEVITPYQPIIKPIPGRRLAVTPRIMSAPVWPGAIKRRRSRPGATALLAVPRLEDRRKLATELFEFARREQVEEEPEVPTPEAAIPLQPDSSTPSREGEPSGEGRLGPGTTATPAGPTIPAGPRTTHRDVYLELLRSLRLRQQATADEAARRREMPPARRSAKRVQDDEADQIIELVRNREVVIVRGLAMPSGDVFNGRMTLAARKLKADMFYDAAANYQLAATMDSRNPLPRVGIGLAKFGAGEPFSAAVALRKALQLLPPLMETRLEIYEMMSKEVADRRLTEVDTRLATDEGDEPYLALLSAFMHQNLQHRDAAKAAARRLLSLAGEDRLLKAYAEYVLTGRRPVARSAETQRAK